MRETVFERFPFMRSSAFERRMLFERGADSQPGRRSRRGLPSSAPRSFRIPERPDSGRPTSGPDFRRSAGRPLPNQAPTGAYRRGICRTPEIG